MLKEKNTCQTTSFFTPPLPGFASPWQTCISCPGYNVKAFLRSSSVSISGFDGKETTMEESTEDDLESLIEGLAFIPGHFHLPLNLNIESSGPSILRLHDTQMKRENLRAELEAETGRLQYAIRNMLGLLAYHLDELEEAEEVFRSICQEDSGNLNAWANLAHVYERLGKDNEESECLERVKSLMDLETCEIPTEGRLRAARCLVEQAFSQPLDVELEQEEDLQERLTTALTLYNQALHYGGELVRQGLPEKPLFIYIEYLYIIIQKFTHYLSVDCYRYLKRRSGAGISKWLQFT